MTDKDLVGKTVTSAALHDEGRTLWMRFDDGTIVTRGYETGKIMVYSRTMVERWKWESLTSG